jgi:hypothetical protein
MAKIDGGISLETAKAQLALAIAALASGRLHACPRLNSLLEDVKYWQQQVARCQRGSRWPIIRFGVAE